MLPTAGLIAVIDSAVIGFTLWILGVPLVIALAAMVFLAAFIALIGILFAGALAIGVTLATKGVGRGPHERRADERRADEQAPR
jgi:predicted PurR-regulated permease PerM